MQYILVDIDTIGNVYQELYCGNVQRYLDMDGIELFQAIPTGLGSQVIDPKPQQPTWAQQDPVVVNFPTTLRKLTKLAFVGRLGNDFYAILQAAKVNTDVEMFVKMLDWATPDPDGTSVDLDDPRVIYALSALEAGGMLATGRAQEILNA